MKSSGIIRRMDEFGRLSVPTSIRELCGIDTAIGERFEILYDEKEHSVTFKLYDTDEMCRKKWIDKWYRAFSTSRAISKRVGDLTIVANHDKIVTTTCRKGDEYDIKVGQAICFAKLNGERIPDYI